MTVVALSLFDPSPGYGIVDITARLKGSAKGDRCFTDCRGHFEKRESRILVERTNLRALFSIVCNARAMVDPSNPGLGCSHRIGGCRRRKGGFPG